MAMSKIEKAGMDASKLKELMGGAGTAAPTMRKDKSGSEDDTDADSSLAGSDVEPDLPGSDEKVLEELEDELQELANGNPSSFDQSGTTRVGSDDADEDIESELGDAIEAGDGKDELTAADDDNEANDDNEDEDYEFDDDEDEIIGLLNDLVDAIEDATDGDHDPDSDSESIDSLAVDLEEAKRTEIPASAASEILDSEVLTSIRDGKPRIESRTHTELMDVGKSDTAVVRDSAVTVTAAAGSAAPAQGDASVATSNTKKPKRMLTLLRKEKKVRECDSLADRCRFR